MHENGHHSISVSPRYTGGDLDNDRPTLVTEAELPLPVSLQAELLIVTTSYYRGADSTSAWRLPPSPSQGSTQVAV